MTKWKIYNEDAVEWAKNYQKGKFHALLCDAPYHLTSIVKRFGKKGSAPAKAGTDGVFQRSSKGFMGTQWDGGDVAFRPETWEAFKEVLYPGAFGMAFSASRNWHRMAVAIEDAGFIIHPTMFFLWINGQGFPKATNISKQIDSRGGQNFGWFGQYLREKREEKKVSQKKLCELGGWYDKVNHGGMVTNWELGYSLPTTSQYNRLVEILDLPIKTLKEVERKVIGTQTKARKSDSGIPLPTSGNTEYHTWDVTESATDLAKTWEGHRYGLQALKPSVEPIIVFQKPYEGKPLDNIVSTGAGALNIDGGRIPTDANDIEKFKRLSGFNNTRSIGGNGMYQGGEILDRSEYDGTRGRWPANLILDEISAERLDLQVGTLKSGKDAVRTREGYFGEHGGLGKEGDVQITYGDEGGASRFFYQISTQLDEADPFLYQSKVSPKERNTGLDEMPETLGGSLDGGNDTRKGKNKPQLHLTKNNHPTLKPIDLAKYLATLLLPPIDYAPRRIFIPFSGSGSEMIGAGLAGWEHVVGVEFDTENGYVDIAKKRLEHWLKDVPD